MTPEQIIDIVRLMDLTAGQPYRSEQELARFDDYTEHARQTYAECRRFGFEAAHDIARAEAIARLLNIDHTGIAALVEADFKRRRDAYDAELKASTNANGDLPREDTAGQQ